MLPACLFAFFLTVAWSLEPPRQLDNYEALIQDVFQIPTVEVTSPPPAPPPAPHPQPQPYPTLPPRPQPQPPTDVYNKHEGSSDNELNVPNVRLIAKQIVC